jgi:hypothetical protein
MLNVLQIGTSFGLTTEIHHAMMRRVSVNAVKSVVTIPTPSVTANPRTGPVPMKNRTTAAMRVVMLESSIVASERLKPASMALIAERP